MTFANAALSFSTIAGSVPAGTKIPIQPVKSNSGYPASIIVGVSGKALEREGPVVARAFNLPDLIWLSTFGMLVIENRVVFASNDVVACDPPEYGTCS